MRSALNSAADLAHGTPRSKGAKGSANFVVCQRTQTHTELTQLYFSDFMCCTDLHIVMLYFFSFPFFLSFSVYFSFFLSFHLCVYLFVSLLIHMGIMWIYVMIEFCSFVRPASQPSCMAKTLTLDITSNFCPSDFFIPPMLIDTMDLYRSISLSLTFTLAGVIRSAQSKTSWFHLLVHFSTDQDETFKQFNLNILLLLLSENL